MGRGRLGGRLGDAVAHGEGAVSWDNRRRHPLSTLRTPRGSRHLAPTLHPDKGKGHRMGWRALLREGGFGVCCLLTRLFAVEACFF